MPIILFRAFVAKIGAREKYISPYASWDAGAYEWGHSTLHGLLRQTVHFYNADWKTGFPGLEL